MVPPALKVLPVSVAESTTEPPTIIVDAERMVVIVVTAGLTVNGSQALGPTEL